MIAQRPETCHSSCELHIVFCIKHDPILITTIKGPDDLTKTKKYTENHMGNNDYEEERVGCINEITNMLLTICTMDKWQSWFRYTMHNICYIREPKSREILVSVCLQKDVKQCCEVTRFDCILEAGQRPSVINLYDDR